MVCRLHACLFAFPLHCHSLSFSLLLSLSSLRRKHLPCKSCRGSTSRALSGSFHQLEMRRGIKKTKTAALIGAEISWGRRKDSRRGHNNCIPLPPGNTQTRSDIKKNKKKSLCLGPPRLVSLGEGLPDFTPVVATAKEIFYSPLVAPSASTAAQQQRKKWTGLDWTEEWTLRSRC